MSVRYEYGGISQPSWLPHQIVREAMIGGKTQPVCRFVVHRLDFGRVPLAEFYPGRFLSGQPPGQVVTSNGTSYVTVKGVTKPVMDPKDPQASGVRPHATTYRAVYVAVAVLFSLGTLVLGLTLRRWAKT